MRRGASTWGSALLPIGLCVAAGHAVSADAMPGVVDKLLRRGEVACEPAWPVFCANFHVACAGQTSLRTFGFTLQVRDGSARLRAMGDDDDRIAEAYARARVVADAANASVLLLPEPSPGYLRLQADGRYALRHYQQHRGLMSVGRCE